MKASSRRLCGALSFLLLSCAEEAPRVTSLNPQAADPGETLVIRGEHFGSERGESYITIGGVPLTSSSYYEWTDTSITVRIPEFGESALVYVYRGQTRSEGALFSTASSLPKAVHANGRQTSVEIRSLSPTSAPIGGTVTLTGTGFGASREGRAVYFTWDVTDERPAQAQTFDGVLVLAVNERENGYESWSDRAIRVRVPDGAKSGPVFVYDANGAPLAQTNFTLSAKNGIKTLRDKRNYTLSYSVNVRVAEAAAPNSLYLWLPQPANSANQRVRELIARSQEPFIDNYRGNSLYKFTDLLPDSEERVEVTYLVECYAVETAVRPAEAKNAAAENPFAAPSPLVPSGDERIVEQAKSLVGRETNPYRKAQLLYTWLVEKDGIQSRPLSVGAIEALENLSADAYSAALLFCALARAQGIPARPVSGILIDRFRGASTHFWAEFWLDTFGWIPVDPALGAGAAPSNFAVPEDSAAYYFGNLDNQRVAFSYGEATLQAMDPRGRPAGRDHSYALQTPWEEAVGSLESYSSLWSDVQVTGVYAH